MGAGRKAHVVGRRAEREVDRLAERLGLERVKKAPVSRRGVRAWGTERMLDRIYTLPGSDREFWVEVKSQAGSGSAYERILALVLLDWPEWYACGRVVVVKGGGIPPSSYDYLLGHGAVDMAGLEAEMRDFVTKTKRKEHDRR